MSRLSYRCGTLVALTLLAACADEPALTAPDLKAGGIVPSLTATPVQLALTLPPGTPATLTARSQSVGTITATSSDPTGCAAVSPSSVAATKPAGSSVIVATFTVTPVALGTCTITLQDKKGQTVAVPVRVDGPVTGGRIVYASTQDGNLEIYLMGSSGTVRLTHTEDREFDPVISPDGQKIAFGLAGSGSTNIYVRDDDGTNPVRLTSHDGGDVQPAYSPDGSRIVFSSYQADYEAGVEEQVPDLWVMNADGTGQERLTFFDHSLFEHGAGASWPRWSPDGNRIVFTLGFQIWIIDADGSNPQQLTTEGINFMPSFSPDGARIVFSHDLSGTTADVWVMNADGTSPVRLTNGNGGAGTPTYSPDGSHIAFYSTRNGNTDVYMIDADGSHELRLTTDPALDLSPRFGP
jgi:Tol biopolymer transport system component